MAGVVERPAVTRAQAATAAVIALTECPLCNARAGQGCRGRYGRIMYADTHLGRRLRASYGRKANPEAWRLAVIMAMEIPRAQYIEQIIGRDSTA